MKRNLLFVLAIALLFTGAGCKGNVDVNANSNNSSTSVTDASAVGEKGRVVVSLTNATANMSGVTAVYLTIDKIEMHSNTKGWITVSNDTKQYELLALKIKGSLVLAAQTMILEGTYNQMRVHVKKIEVVKSGRKSEAKLPSNTIEVAGQFTVSRTGTTSINLDFVADQSLHVTGNGTFIFTPVIKVEARTNATVSVLDNEMVTVGGGMVDTSATMGMDINGTMQDNFKVDAGSKLEIKNDVIEIVGSTTVKAGTETGATLKPVL